MAPSPLDRVDRAIVRELSQDGRLSVAALAERVHVSRAHCYSRLNRLQDTGVITGFSARVDPVKTGFTASAHVMLKLRQHDWRELRATLLAIPEVWHVSLVGGNMDVILLVRARDTADLRHVIFERLQPLPAVVDTQTYMIFDDHASGQTLPPEPSDDPTQGAAAG
ncbi:Lrp/AsnC family transcriptional regulator [Micrococcus flavus]|uniref:DNA-binding Lrp family transcriptional regulator n=1 Tax=Micrococcus flavus TaxID=384602 RepID=A0A4Y8X3X2_9MICC|nr:Lrp/AsnC family transcriptional regulator [Micrococcus flavus]MBB4882080.1 DNA-binding Lrp family transcriptional regulator [Micrococcus flavus]TFI03982.1 Lrp/AsnC family transcriptional regulator [Micrococcus flavus]GGK50134.1 AsnC family transcriptional regulator [Micrococcus flavus]